MNSKMQMFDKIILQLWAMFLDLLNVKGGGECMHSNIDKI